MLTQLRLSQLPEYQTDPTLLAPQSAWERLLHDIDITGYFLGKLGAVSATDRAEDRDVADWQVNSWLCTTATPPERTGSNLTPRAHH